MTDHDVVIAGAGPTGLMLAGELALAGVDVALVERRPDQNLAGSRAGGVGARTLEVFDQRGLVERFLAAGQTAQVAGFGSVRLDLSAFPTRHPYGLALRQKHIERILAEWVEELAVPIYRSRDVTGFTQHDHGVTIALSDNTALQASYLVGCDGGRSLVRKLAGIDFPGWDPTISNILAEAEMREDPPLGVHRTALGMHAFGRENYELVDGQIIYAKTGPIGIMVTEPAVGATAEPTLEDLRAILIAACGTDYGIHNLSWISRFTDMSRQAASYRQGRVLLAGDAAHVHSPVGGQGLSVGVQDAVNLGWKLAQVVKGIAPETLLDSYHAERHKVAARVVRTTMAQVALQRTDDRTDALRAIIADFLAMDEPYQKMAAELSGLGIHYDFGEGHKLLGRRMPDLDLLTPNGPQRLYTLLHHAQPILLNLGAALSLDVAPWADRIQVLQAQYHGPWNLPALGNVPAPSAVLIRPDGYVAWVGEGSEAGLAAALTRWFGPPH